MTNGVAQLTRRPLIRIGVVGAKITGELGARR